MKPNQGEIENLNRPIANKKTDLIINKTFLKEKPKARWLYLWIVLNIYRGFGINPSQNLQKKIKGEWLPFKAFYEDYTTLIPKPDKTVTRKVISFMNSPVNIDSKSLEKGKHSLAVYKKDYILTIWDLL